MRASQYIIPTFKEVPAEAVVASHKLMIRAGLIRKQAAGLYFLLPLGLRVIQKIEKIIRQELNKAGAIEFQLPILTSAELWQKSKRWDAMGPEMFRVKDRHDNDLVLGPTHEEAMTYIMSMLLKSYKDLPKNVYQMHTKFRDEIRPRYGLIRCREFIMKDAYSFHVDDQDLDREYENMRRTYKNIFERCGLKTVVCQADSGAMGGSGSEEFMVASEIGEEVILSCPECAYAGNQEKTKSLHAKPSEASPFENESMQEIHTPQVGTIDDLTRFFNIKADMFIKTLLFSANTGDFIVCLRGDREVNLVKLANLISASDLYQASAETVGAITGASIGFAGPIGLKKEVPIYFDESLRALKGAVSGANKTDYHFTGINLAKSFPEIVFHDLALAEDGDSCPNCEAGKLRASKGIEVGHIFKLGKKYTEAFNLKLLDKNGKTQVPTMGTYGIGVNRTLQTIVEQSHDENGIIFPLSVAPFEIIIIPISQKSDEKAQIDEFYEHLLENNYDVLLDDRDERPGYKFKDADLIGYPLRITIGKSFFNGGREIEVKIRSEQDIRKIKVEKLIDLTEEIGQLLETMS